MKSLNRREFLRMSALTATGVAFGACVPKSVPPAFELPRPIPKEKVAGAPWTEPDVNGSPEVVLAAQARRITRDSRGVAAELAGLTDRHFGVDSPVNIAGGGKAIRETVGGKVLMEMTNEMANYLGGADKISGAAMSPNGRVLVFTASGSGRDPNKGSGTFGDGTEVVGREGLDNTDGLVDRGGYLPQAAYFRPKDGKPGSLVMLPLSPVGEPGMAVSGKSGHPASEQRIVFAADSSAVHCVSAQSNNDLDRNNIDVLCKSYRLEDDGSLNISGGYLAHVDLGEEPTGQVAIRAVVTGVDLSGSGRGEKMLVQIVDENGCSWVCNLKPNSNEVGAKVDRVVWGELVGYLDGGLQLIVREKDHGGYEICAWDWQRDTGEDDKHGLKPVLTDLPVRVVDGIDVPDGGLIIEDLVTVLGRVAESKVVLNHWRVGHGDNGLAYDLPPVQAIISKRKIQTICAGDSGQRPLSWGEIEGKEVE